ncbi:MAG TPA: GMC family oxidoreductase [Steroidobacteraceae bacterium]|jgi:choline dehydrogenase-like flavoprotein|nr:GMC family oxidoreductase [Steroidobacteraceae bacterium]
MIEDALQYDADRTLTADVCVIGAGAAGITLALELAGRGVDVLLVESGGHKADDRTQRLYEGAVADERMHSPPHRYRQRRFGGSTTIWGGRCMPFDEIDFESRPYVGHSGWPIDRAALLPFYARANQLCEAGRFEYRAGEAFHRPLRPVIDGFDSQYFTIDGLERFSCPTDFGARYEHRLRASPRVRVLINANLTDIRLNAAGTAADSLVLRTFAQRCITVRASRVVLAMGALEIPRMLLASRSIQSHGIGNQHDNVGRYYMCHVAGTIGTLIQDGNVDRVWHGYDISDEGIYCRRRLQLTEQTQRRLQLGNFIGRLHHPRITDPAHRSAVLSALQLAKGMISYEYGKRLHGEEKLSVSNWLAHLRNVVTGPHQVVGFGYHMLRDRFLAARKFPSIIVRSPAGRYSLDFHGEQEPLASSRITLDSACDEFDTPRMMVDWRYSDLDVRTVRESVRLFAEDIARCKIGRFEYDPGSIEFEMTRYGAYGGHHLGTARMGDDPRTSVVDRNCRVHDVHNLYLAGGAVFPTSSQANPTLTIVALAARLAAHLQAEATRERSSISTTRPVAVPT